MKNLFKQTRVIYDAHLEEYQVYYKNFLFWKFDCSYGFDSPQSPYKTKSYIEKQKKIQTEKQGREFIAISPDGLIYHSKGLKEFCRTHKLTPQCAGAVLNGHKSSHKGWIFKKSV